MQSRNNSDACGIVSTVAPSYSEPLPDARQTDCSPLVGPHTDNHVPPFPPITLAPPLNISADVLAAVVQHSTEVISINDAHGVVRYISPSVEQILGYKPDEMVGRQSTDYLHPDDLAEVQEGYKAYTEYKHPGRYVVLRLRHRNGSWRVMEAHAKNLLDHPAIHGIVVHARDVTEHWQAIHERDQMFNTSQSLLAVITMDTGVIHQVNPAWQRILGYAPEQLVNTLMSDLLHPDEHEQNRQAWLQLQATGTLHDSEARIRHHDGSYRWVRWHATYHPDTQLIYSVGQDITEQREQEQQMQLLTKAIEHSSDAVVITDAELDLPGPRILFVNAAFTQMTGYTAEEVLGQTPRILQGPLTNRQTLDELRAKLTRGENFEGQTINYRKDGTPYYVNWSISALRNAQGQITHYVSVQRDQTHQALAHQFELDQHEILELIARGQPLTEIITRVVASLEHQHPQRRIRVHLYTHADQQHITATMPRLNAPKSRTIAPLNPLYPQGTPTSSLSAAHAVAWEQFQIVLKDQVVAGELRCYSEHAEPLTVNDWSHFETATRLIALAIEHEQLSRRLVYYTHQDDLTGLPNRTRCLEYIQQAITSTRRPQQLLAVALIDLDNFTQINEFYGHAAGDQLLCMMADRITMLLPEQDLLARTSNDEFAWVISNVASEPDAVREAQHLIDHVREPFRLGEYEIAVQVHIGISFYPTDGNDAFLLLERADNALQQARRHPHHNVMCFAPDMTARTLQRLSRERQLRRAIQRNELVLHYQPQYDLLTNRLIGLEALVRWQLPDGELLPPSEFIPIAEESNLILDVGQWVLRAACRQAAVWQQQQIVPVRVAVNISALQLAQVDFVRQVQRALQEYHVDPHWLELELTESLLMHDYQLAASQLHQLRQLGVRIAIDDFGTGYSSLAHLQQLPVDVLKIDRVFIQRILHEPENMHSLSPDGVALVSAMITLAHNFHLQVIAEGVETAAQISTLRYLECDAAQGYGLSRPLPASAIELRLTQGLGVKEAHQYLAK